MLPGATTVTPIPPSTDRRRLLCPPPAAWPPADRDRWQAGTQRGDCLLDDGPGTHLRPGGLKKHAAGYGRWLAWLDEQGWLAAEMAVDPADRVTPERVAAYIAALEQANASRTVLNRLASLATVLGWYAPERDWSWLNRSLAKLRARVRPVRDKRARLRSAHDLLALGQELMAAAAAAVGAGTPALPLRRRRCARLYRDGLMIALLATRPLRLANLVQLELGHELVRRGDAWWLEIPGAATKNGELIELPFPDNLVEALESYLAVWRPQLARPERVKASQALWLTHQGTTISDIHAYNNIVAHTRDAFGQPVNPHLFRDAAATTIALDSPKEVRIAARLLGHRCFATTERYYNLARMAEAAASWYDTLHQLQGDGADSRAVRIVRGR